MPQQFTQVVERVRAVQFASMNEAHKEVPHVRPVHGLIKEPILAVQNGFLQGTFHDVMPTHGLCRVGGFANRPALFLMFAYAA